METAESCQAKRCGKSQFTGKLRWQGAWVDARLRQEERYSDGHAGDVGSRTAGAHMEMPYRILRRLLLLSGLYRRGVQNYLSIRCEQQIHHLRGWPKALAGVRILHLSDLHMGLEPRFGAVLNRQIQGLEAELICFTGDFGEAMRTDRGSVRQSMMDLLKCLPAAELGVFGVLGNHDCLADAVWLEELGIRMLMNEGVDVAPGPDGFYLGGVDDAFRFGTHDVVAAAAGKTHAAAILLSHSPQLAPQAERQCFQLMLSGHTHGGQICLPGGRPLALMPEIPRKLFSGKWRFGNLLGYTSRGCGASHLPIRFNCPAEITLHRIYPAE